MDYLKGKKYFLTNLFLSKMNLERDISYSKLMIFLILRILFAIMNDDIFRINYPANYRYIQSDR